MEMLKLISRRLVSPLLVLGVIFLGGIAARAEAPKVVVSILPISGLVASIMDGVDKPVLLMPADRSPHDFQLVPSQAKALQSADLVIWIGPGMEGFLPKALKSLSSKATAVRLIDTDGLSFPEGGHEHEHEDDDDHAKDGHEEDEIANLDHHIWLNPENAIAIAKRIAKELAAIDPENQKTYVSNTEQLVEKLTKVDQELNGSFSRVRENSYLVFHQAYRHFEKRYGLQNAGSVISHEEVSPGARRVQKLNKLISTGTIQCVFSEPQYDPKLARSVLAGSDAKTQVLDPMGQGIDPGPDHYIQLIRALARSMKECLS